MRSQFDILSSERILKAVEKTDYGGQKHSKELFIKLGIIRRNAELARRRVACRTVKKVL